MSDEVRTRRLVIVDDAGNERAVLGFANKGVSLEFLQPGGDRPAVALQLLDNGEACLTLTHGNKTAEIKLAGRDASIRLMQSVEPKTSCAMRLDATGAWVVAEATHDVGARLLCRADESASSVWLSETFSDGGETCVRTRYVRPDPAEDKAGAWRTSR